MGSGGESSVCLRYCGSFAVDSTGLLMDFEGDGYFEIGEDDAENGDYDRLRFPGRADKLESLGIGLCFDGVGCMSEVCLFDKNPL